MLIVALTGAFAPASVSTQPVKPVCSVTFTQSQHASYTRKVYKRPEMSRTALRRVERMRRCQSSPRAVRNALKFTREMRRQRRVRQEMRALTPYDCGSHGWFAVPCAVIQCESNFNWNAHNPSGADGIYQLLPGVGPDRMAQHRAAAAKWQGGAGASHWVCRA